MKLYGFFNRTPLYLAAEKGNDEIFHSLILHPAIEVNKMNILFF